MAGRPLIGWDLSLQLESGFRPERTAPFKNDTRFPSSLEGMRGIVGKKAGGLADARHMYNE